MELTFLDGHNLKIGDGWRDIGYANGTHVWTAGSENAKDPFEIYQKAYAPTYGYSGSSNGYNISVTNLAGSSCSDTADTKTATGSASIYVTTIVSALDCGVHVSVWDITSISVFSTITDTSFRFDVTAVSNPRNCDFTLITYNPNVVGMQTLWDDITGIISNTNYITDDVQCTTVANNYVYDLGTNADASVQINLLEGWFAMGIKYNNMIKSGVQASNDFGSTLASRELQITYTAGSPAPTGCEDPITDLRYTAINYTTADLAWTTPTLNGQTITGYQINKTTPFATPLTVIVNNTGSTSTTYQVTGLTANTAYSFRVQPWTTADCHTPADGNRLDLITSPLTVPGSLPTNTTNATNPINVGNNLGQDQTGCVFTRDDINATSLILNITYPYTDDPAMNFHYKYAMTNQTYLNPTVLPVSSTHNRSSFQFNGVNNEIIDVRYWDENTNRTCKYIITQTQFEFLNLLADFRAGEFGTMGQFGVIDLITLLAAIIAMIGFNRQSPIVAGVFIIITTGALAYFEIIVWYTPIIGALAVVIALLVAGARKDN